MLSMSISGWLSWCVSQWWVFIIVFSISGWLSRCVSQWWVFIIVFSISGWLSRCVSQWWVFIIVLSISGWLSQCASQWPVHPSHSLGPTQCQPESLSSNFYNNSTIYSLNIQRCKFRNARAFCKEVTKTNVFTKPCFQCICGSPKQLFHKTMPQ